MSASDSADAGIPINKRIIFWRVLRDRLQIFSRFRWAFLLIGIASIARGQYLIEQRYLQGEPIAQAEIWNAIYKLHIVNFDNALHALPFFIGGAFLCALTVLPLAWKAPFDNWKSDTLTREKFGWNGQLPYILFGGALFMFLIVRLAKHEYGTIYPILWTVSIAAFTHAAWRGDKNAKKDLSSGITVLDIFWIASLLLLGFIINSIVLQDIPAILVPDEGSFWETARGIATHEIEPAIFDSGVYSFPVASSIYQGWVLRIFGINLWGWRFSSVIAGVLAVIPLYLLGREWFNRRVAIAAVVIMVANPYFLSFARLGYNNSQSLFPVVLCIYFFALAARKGSLFYLWLAGITAGIGFYTYSAAWLGLVALCLGILHLFLLKQMKWKEALLSLGIILLAWGLMTAPRIAYTASGENSRGLVYKIFETSFVNTFYAKAYYGEADLIQTTPLIHFSESDTLFYDPVIYRELLLRGTVRTLLAIFDPYITREHFLITGFAGYITPVFFLIGLALSMRLWKQLRFGLPLVWLATGLVFLSIIAAFPPRHTHLVSVIPVIALITSIGISATIESLAELLLSPWKRILPAVQTILLAVAIIIIAYFESREYFVTMPSIYPPSFEDIASWIAWKTEEPVGLIYLGQEDKPHRVQYLVDSKLVPHSYQSLRFNEFSLETNGQTIIFVENNDEILESTLRNLAGFSVPIPYIYTDGSVLGYVITNTVIDLAPTLDWEDGWQSLAGTPVRWILISLAMAGAVSGNFALKEHRRAREGIGSEARASR